MAIVSDLFFATSDVFMRKGKEDWHGANWEGARSFIDNVLEPAPKVSDGWRVGHEGWIGCCWAKA